MGLLKMCFSSIDRDMTLSESESKFMNISAKLWQISRIFLGMKLRLQYREVHRDFSFKLIKRPVIYLK